MLSTPRSRRWWSQGKGSRRRFLSSKATPWPTLALILLLGLWLVVSPAVVLADDDSAPGKTTENKVIETEGAGANANAKGKGQRRKAILETPYLCRLGKRYPWIRTFVDERLDLYDNHIEWRETGGNPRLIVFDEGNAIKSLIHFKDEHKDVETIIREKLEL